MKFLDLHTHILPGVDDGAQTVEDSLQMLRNAAASHVAAVVATPHSNVLPHWENYDCEAFRGRLLQLRQLAAREGIPVQIIAGAEVRVTEELPELLRQKKIMSINAGVYLLAEFAPWDAPDFMLEQLEKIRDRGYIPLIAHPERYGAVCRSPSLVGDWLEMGCHIQMTAGSILGKFGPEARKAAEYLLRNNMTACVASDAHGVRRRTNFLMEVYDHLSLKYGKGFAQALLWETPLRICAGEPL